MIASPPAGRRGGYTLLEVLLSTVIALFLLAGLYVALDITLVRMDASRDVVTTGDLSRAVVNRMAADLVNTLGPLPPKSGADAAPAAVADTAPTGTAGATTSTGPAGTTTTGGATTGAADDATQTATAVLPFGLGLVGSDAEFTVFCSRLPAAVTDVDAAAAGGDVGLPGDQRRVSYYIASDGSGLCRQERPWVTAPGVGDGTDPDRADEAGDVIAPEVKAMTVEYYDGSGWQTEWDGSVADADGAAVTGPPRAVRVTLTLEFPGRNGVAVRSTVVHTIPVRAAVGNYVPPSPTSTGGK